MNILIDGDGCPNVECLFEISVQYLTKFTVYYDYAHCVNEKPYAITYVDKGFDSVDMKIIQDCQKNDLVVTQDYGLAALLLSKGCFVLHVSGLVITSDNIETLLLQRYMGKKERDKNVRMKHKKRSEDIKQHFLVQYENILKQNQTNLK